MESALSPGFPAAPFRAAHRTRSVGLSWLRHLIPSVADLVFLGCLLVCVAASTVMLSADGDPSRHLVVGERILATGAIPNRDVFSHTMAGQPFVPYEWLSEVASAASARAAGLAGPVLLHGSAIGLSFAMLYALVRSRGAAVLLALAITLLATMASTMHWLARPHIFTFVGTAIFYSILCRWYAGSLSRKWLWALPLVMVVWANLHGGFLIGLVVGGAFVGADVLRSCFGKPEVATAAGARLKALLPVAAAVFAAILLNPAGPSLLFHVTGYLGKSLLVDNTQEYRSPDFHKTDVRVFLIMLLVTLGALAWSRRRPALHEGLLVTGFTYFSLYSGRNIPLFAIITAPVLVPLLQGAYESLEVSGRAGTILKRAVAWLARRDAAYSRIDSRAQGHLWPVVAVLVLLGIAWAQARAGQDPLGAVFNKQRLPVDAVAYLKQHVPEGNGFNEFHWGGYLLHELWPAQRVFIDGQTDFYGEALTREYLDAALLHAGWRDVLDRYDVRWVIFSTDTPFVRALEETPGWHAVYSDDVATVLLRDPA
jgi:hypothetical protein